MIYDSFNQLYLKRQAAFASDSGLIDCRFDNDNRKVPQISHADHYVRHWDQMASKGLGLLFWGPPGTGKTFAAGCIANALLESPDPFAPSVIMTNFAVILRHTLSCSPQEREDYINRLLDCGLLILDDFGMERQSEFSQEQIFALINGRYLARKPMILTTNLTLQEMKQPQTMAQRRIFDRVLEICVPVFFEGESLRKEKAAENLQFYRSILNGNNPSS